MRIGRKLLLALCATSMCAGVAYAQVPPTLGPGVGDDTSYKVDSDDHYKRVDKNATDPNIVYMTVGQKSPFWVVANYAENPGVDRNNVNLTGLAAKWSWEFHNPAAVGAKFGFEGYTPGTVTQGLNKVVLESKPAASAGDEVIIKVTENSDCAGGLSTYFKVVLTGKPSLKIIGATIDGTINCVEKSLATGAGIHTEIENSKGFEFETCNPALVANKVLAIKLASVEQGAPAALQKYAFSIKGAEYHHTKGSTTAVAATNVSDKVNHTTDAGSMAAVSTSGTVFNITLPNDMTLPATEDYVDYVYYLSNSLNNPAKLGVVSAISQRSEIATPGTAPAYLNHTFFPYTKTDGYYVRVRIKATPSTGPVYFIPYLN